MKFITNNIIPILYICGILFHNRSQYLDGFSRNGPQSAKVWSSEPTEEESFDESVWSNEASVYEEKSDFTKGEK